MIVVLAPTRGRPKEAGEMAATFRATTHLFATELVLVVDRNDPKLPGYLELPARFMGVGSHGLAPPDAVRVMVLDDRDTGSLVKATNSAARRVWDDECIIGHVGDDHRFRTDGWDSIVTGALAEPGIAYGNDGHWGPKIATSVFMSSVIPRALGWYALPSCRHNGWDNAVVDLGKAAGCLTYLPDVYIEHPDPAMRRTSTDPGYVRARSRQAEDKVAYKRWLKTGLNRDAAKVEEATKLRVAS